MSKSQKECDLRYLNGMKEKGFRRLTVQIHDDDRESFREKAERSRKRRLNALKKSKKNV